MSGNARQRTPRKAAPKKPAGSGGRAHTPEKREAVALSIALGGALQDVATEHRVDAATIRRWRQEPEFVKLITTFRSEVNAQVIGVQVDARRQALERVIKALANEDDRIGVRAANVILNHTLRPEEATQADDEHLPLIIEYLQSLGPEEPT